MSLEFLQTQNIGIVNQTSNYVLKKSDSSNLINMNVASSNSVTIPNDSSVDFLIGTKILVLQSGIGQTSILGGVGVTLYNQGGVSVLSQYAICQLIKVSNNVWNLQGIGYVPTLTSAAIISALGYTPVDVNGDTMLGNLILNADPTNPLGAATKQYVDNLSGGVNFHSPTYAATTTNLSANYSNGSSGVGATLTATSNGALIVDGVDFSLLPIPTQSYRVLVWQQSNQIQNGIYDVTQVGGVSSPFILTRSADADNSPSGELAYGDFSLNENGTLYGGYGFIMNASGTINIGSSNITYVQYNVAQAITAGTGMTESPANTLNIDVTQVPYYSGGFGAGGFSKYNGVSWVFDTNTYLTTSNAASTYLSILNASLTYYPLTNPSGYITSAALVGYVPTTRTITTNAPLAGGGDLSADRTLSISQSNTSTDGYLSSTDWNTFNNKFSLPALTSGSVLFSNGSTISQNNSNLFWDNTNVRLGIGTNTPTERLTVSGNILANLTGSTSVKIYDVTGINTIESNAPTLISSTGGNYVNIRASGDFGIQTNGSSLNKLVISTSNNLGNTTTQFNSTLFAQGNVLASTECKSVLFNGNTKTWQTGNIATQRWFHISANTAAFAGSSTITDNYSVYIDATIVGSNAAITNNYALGLGASLFLSEGANIVVGTSTGTKIGTSTTQKLGFYNATPIVQPSAVTTTQGISDALTSLGLLSSSTIQTFDYGLTTAIATGNYLT